MAPLAGARSKPEGLGRYRGTTTCGQRDPVARGSRELDNCRVDQGGRDVALLALAEALQSGLESGLALGPAADSGAPCSIGRPTVTTLRSDSSRFAYAESGTAPVASNTELKKQRAAAPKHDVEDVDI